MTNDFAGLDWQPNPSDPALAKVLPGDLTTTRGGRRLKEMGRYCQKCERVTYIKADEVGTPFEHQMQAFPCPICEEPYAGQRMNLKRGWIHSPIAENISFNPKTAFLPSHHLPPSLANERYVR